MEKEFTFCGSFVGEVGGEKVMVGVGRLSALASRERYRAKNRESLAIKRRINYYKRKVKDSEKELKELEKKEAKGEK